MKDLFLITPPFTQLNTPYPATAYLKGFLNAKSISSFQMDLGIEVMLELFSKHNLQHVFDLAFKGYKILSANARRIYALREAYLVTIEEVIAFLQGKNQTYARQICTEYFLPQASRFEQLEELDWAFGFMGFQDKAKHLATLYLEDLSDFIIECIDENFGFSRYAERLGKSANSFDELHAQLKQETTFIDNITLNILDGKLKILKPKLVCISVPFPGNLYSAFRCAQFIKKNYLWILTSMGGGFPTTELRTISDIRVFDFFDYISLDDGELPIELLLHHISHSSPDNPHNQELKRTFLKENGKVVYNNCSPRKDYTQPELGAPDYTDLLLDQYISVIEVANPMHSLWSDGRWNKLTLAHGCYWGKCTFCDVSLDYIKRYEPIDAKLVVDRIEELIAKTGEKGFHFVDEAAPPALMREVALEILRRKITVTWWTNIRFEKNFTKDLCVLLKASGCIAVSGGLEVASDRLLVLIKKGVTVGQVALVAGNFTDAGIMVHAYLMYGFPSQTEQETVDSLELVRQMFELGIIQSGFWHQFALTAHSPVGLNPSDYNIIPDYKNISFADNDIQFKDKTGIDHEKFSFGLKKSLFNFMHGIGFELPLQDWFDFKIPKTSIHNNFIESCLNDEGSFSIKPSAKIICLGGMPLVSNNTKSRRGDKKQVIKLTFHDKGETFEVTMDKDKGEWFLKTLDKLAINENAPRTFGHLKADYEKYFDDFELFWYSKPIISLRASGLLVL